jgi:NAD kinase
VLVIKKRDEPQIVEILREMAKWLKTEKNITVMVEPHVRKELYDIDLETFEENEVPNLTKKLDLIICLGGDGTGMKRVSKYLFVHLYAYFIHFICAS